MATLYWGGGSGTWDAFTTSNWYTDFARTVPSTRAPSAEDDVIFDAASSATSYTVTLGTTSPNLAVCRDFTVGAPASGSVTIGTGTSTSIYIYGSLSLPASGASFSIGGLAALIFYGAGTHTITTNGVTIPSISQTGAGTYTLQDALTTTQAITISNGTFNTNNNTVTSSSYLGHNGASTFSTINLGSSTVNALEIRSFGNLTLNAGTSNITLSNNVTIGGIGGSTAVTGFTFNNVTITGIINTTNIYGNNTFNNLTFTAPTQIGNCFVNFYGNQTITGTLTISGQSGSNRYFLASNTIGTARTITANAISALTDVSFRDITAAGASAPWSGTRLGNGLGNTNITFPAGTTRYIAGGTSTNPLWDSNIWASISGGSASSTNFPLPQDDVVIDNAGLATSRILTVSNNVFVKSVNFSSRSNAMTLLMSNASYGMYVGGDFTLSSAVTTSINTQSLIIFVGRTTQTITTAGKNFPVTVINSPGGTVIIGDSLSSNQAGALNLINGTFNSNSKALGFSGLTVSGSAPKTLTLGSSVLTGNGFSTGTGASNLTVTPNTATLNINSGDIGFTGITTSFGGTVSLTNAGGVLYPTGTTTVANLTISSAPTAQGATSRLVLYGNLTVTGTLALAGGTSVSQRAFVRSDTQGTQRTLSAGTVTGLTDVDFRDIAVAGTANWTTGTRLGDCGNNSGITFPSPKTVYWNLAGTNNWSATAWAPGSGGTPAVNNFPLAQDTAVFDDTGAATAVTFNGAWNVGTINASSRTSALTFSGSGQFSIYGNVTYGSGITPSNTGTYLFSGRGTQTFTTSGKTVAGITINKPAGTFQHGDAFSSNGSITVGIGAYTTQNYNVSCSSFLSTATTSRSITLGTSTVTVVGNVNFSTPTGLTFSGASSTLIFTSSGNKTFSGGGLTYGTVSVTAGTALTTTMTISGNNTIASFLGSSAYSTLILTASSTQTIGSFTYTGAVGNVVRLVASVPGLRATLVKTGAALGFGANSTDGGNNSNVSFTGVLPNYLYVKDIIYSGALPSVSSGNFLLAF